MYGESVFTTMRMVDGEMKDWHFHFDRLKRGVEFLYGPFTDSDDWPILLRDRIEAKFSDISGDKVVRITIYREGTRGVLRSGIVSTSDLKIHFSSSILDKSRFENKMLKLRTCPQVPRPHWWPSFLKAGNYLETILSQKIYMKPEDDDVLFLSGTDTVLESSIANVFVVKDNILYTAPTGPNVLDGVMRRKVLNVGMNYFNYVLETEITMEQLLKADAVFGSNSVRGLFLVDRVDDYEITYTKEFLNKFEFLNREVFL